MASLVKMLVDFQIAEDCLQDALLSALEHWERSDLPRSPAAWLLKAARRKAIDRIRRDRGFAAKLLELAYLYELENNSDDAEDNAVIPDERLQIIFICYHSVLAEKSRVALTLRALGVLSKSQLLFWTQMKRCSGGSRVRKRKLWEQRSPIRYQT